MYWLFDFFKWQEFFYFPNIPNSKTPYPVCKLSGRGPSLLISISAYNWCLLNADRSEPQLWFLSKRISEAP